MTKTQRLAMLLGALVAGVCAPLAGACSSSDTIAQIDPGATGSGAGSGQGGGSSVCAPACLTDDVCIDGQCCPGERECGGACCSESDVCSFQQCVTPGATCLDRSECAPGEYCEPLLGEPASMPDAGPGCVGGAVVPTGKCLPEPPTCGPNDPGITPDGDPTCVTKCEYVPATSDFTAALKYTWGGTVVPPYDTDVVSNPVVIQMDDDDCDGKVTERDIPEIAFVSMANSAYHAPGTLHVVSIIGGAVVEKWTLPDSVYATSGLAAGDLDGDGIAELVACSPPPLPALTSGVVAFTLKNGTLQKLWEQLDPSIGLCQQDYLSIGDPAGTGHPVVLFSYTLLDGVTGAVVKSLAPQGEGITSLADMNGDGVLDVVGGQRAFEIDGTPLWNLSAGPATIPAGFHAIGDLDGDGTPEVIVTQYLYPEHGSLSVVSYDPVTGPKVIRSGFDLGTPGGGPPTVADFDGDGSRDVGVAGNLAYVTFSGKALMDLSVADPRLWSAPTQENKTTGAATGSSVFDFDGDGRSEVVYADAERLHIFDGKTGAELAGEVCNTSATLYEYPVVADVDNDGQADLVVASNAFYDEAQCNGTRTSGVRVFGSATSSWVRTRRVWNQHTYHITNVEEDGTIPKQEKPNWLEPGLDNFRQNLQPGTEHAAPDAIVTVAPRCSGDYGLEITVRNIGQSALPAGVVVGAFAGTVELGQVTTTVPLYSAQAELLFLPLAEAPGTVVASIDPAWVQGVNVHQCRTDNDASPPVSGQCDVPK
jgi:hypothetical protein